MRTLREGRVADQVQGQRIVYNNTTEVMNVDGKLQGSDSRQRVRAVLAPKASASAPAVAVPPLKPSPALPQGGRP